MKQKPPAWLDENTLKKWSSLERAIARKRTISMADYLTLEMLCQQYMIWKDASIKLQKTGLLYQKSETLINSNPLLRVVNDSAAEINRLMVQLGLISTTRYEIRSMAIKIASRAVRLVTDTFGLKRIPKDKLRQAVDTALTEAIGREKE